MSENKPTVLCFSGLDPTGAAGIQADIETLFSIGCHCAPVITALTAQNTQNVIAVEATEPSLLVQQARAVLEDIPVVLDPVISAGGGYEFGGDEIIEAMRSLLIPLTMVLTPNTEELSRLAPTADTLDACANELLDTGCQHILLTGTHAQTPDVVNKLYAPHQGITVFNWPRLENNYHGSGCTLAAAIAGYLAHKLTLPDAIQQAQRFTWEALSHGTRMGFGQHTPNRSFWNKQIL